MFRPGWVGSGLTLGGVLLLAVATFTLNVRLGGSIASREALSNELTIVRSQPEPHYAQAPFKYRVLFRLVVDALARAAALVSLPGEPPEASSLVKVSALAPPSWALYASWLSVSLLCLLSVPLLLRLMLRQLGFSDADALQGAVLWLLLPPAYFAYIFPVHTRDDMLAQVFLILGLIGILADRYWMVVACTVLGVLTRETVMVLPLSSLFWPRFPWGQRFAVVAAGACTLGAVRLALGWESYPALAWGLGYNAGHPLEAAAGVWLVFSWLWYPAVRGMLEGIRRSVPYAGTGQGDALSKSADAEIAARRAFIAFSAIPASLVLLGSQVLFARLREIRISFLLAPWVIAAALAWLQPRAPRRDARAHPLRRFSVLGLGACLWIGLTLSVYILPSVHWRLGAFGEPPWSGLLVAHGLLAVVAWHTTSPYPRGTPRS
jgi:hypothetical protein